MSKNCLASAQFAKSLQLRSSGFAGAAPAGTVTAGSVDAARTVVAGFNVANGPAPAFKVVDGNVTVGNDAATLPFEVPVDPLTPVPVPEAPDTFTVVVAEPSFTVPFVDAFDAFEAAEHPPKTNTKPNANTEKTRTSLPIETHSISNAAPARPTTKTTGDATGYSRPAVDGYANKFAFTLPSSFLHVFARFRRRILWVWTRLAAM